jgi:hypothetical protein
MDIYRILEKLAVISNKQTLTEGRVKRDLEDLARQVSKEKFVADAGEYGMGKEEAAEFWANSNSEELDEERRSEEDWDAQALAQQKAKLSREKNKMDMQRRMQNPEKYAKDNIDEAEAAGQFKTGDRVMYNNTFATIAGQDGDAYIVKVDKQPNTMKVPATAIKKPSYNEGVSENKKAKPDFLDMDKDGDKKEPMKKAVKDKNDTKGAFQKQMGGSARDLTKGLSIGAKSVSENKNDLPFDVDPKEKAAKKVTPGKHGQEYSQVRHLARKGMSADAKKSSKQDKLSESDMEESALQAYLGKKKYGSEGMKALQQAGRDGAGKEKMAKIRARHDKMDEAEMDEGNKFAHNVLKAKAAGIKQADLDGDGDMETVREMFPGTPEYELRFGKDDASSAFDKKKISTGTVYSRRYQDDPEADDDTPRAAGRPKGSKRRLGAKGPSVDSKLLKGKGGLKEGDIDIVDRGEYDREGDMALSQVHQIADAARELHAILASDDNLPEWVQSKITKALDYIDTARDYLDAEKEMDREELPEIAPIVGALAGRALAGAAGAGRVGQAVGSMAGRGIASAMNSNDGVEEAGYSAKAARAGKDIGKPGKNFGKIAKGAAERYGSKAAGERVAGAVLNKLRAKEGVEEGSREFNKIKTTPYKANQMLGGKDPVAFAIEVLCPDQSVVKTIQNNIGTAYQIERDDSIEGNGIGIEIISQRFEGGQTAQSAYKQILDIIKQSGGQFNNSTQVTIARQTQGVEEGPDTGIGSKLPKSDIETFGLQKGRPYKINPPEDFKPGDRKRAVQQLIPTQDKKDHIRSRLGKHVAPVLPEQDVEEGGKDRAAGKKSGIPSSISTAELKAELKRRTKTDSESTDTQDQRAEKAGKKVAKDIEHDEGHKGRDDAKAEKAGKKVAKDIEYDDKKDKEKKVDETTVSGSVATGGDAPKKSKGGMQFGQGVYEGAIAESFNKKLGGILTEGMSVNVSTDDTGKKSITVNATDADADSLGNMLKMAGLFSSEGYSRTCEHCHGIHEAGACQAEQVAEELANSPDEVYADKDYMTQTLSGGLNGPKTTGQTTGPIVNQQPGRQGVMAEAERVVEQSESRLWNLYKQYEKK